MSGIAPPVSRGNERRSLTAEHSRLQNKYYQYQTVVPAVTDSNFNSFYTFKSKFVCSLLEISNEFNLIKVGFYTFHDRSGKKNTFKAVLIGTIHQMKFRHGSINKDFAILFLDN
jgi:hypothetical protein